MKALTSPLLKISQLARKLGISRGYLNMIAKGERPLSDAMRERIEQIITEEFKLTP